MDIDTKDSNSLKKCKRLFHSASPWYLAQKTTFHSKIRKRDFWYTTDSNKQKYIATNIIAILQLYLDYKTSWRRKEITDILSSKVQSENKSFIDYIHLTSCTWESSIVNSHLTNYKWIIHKLLTTSTHLVVHESHLMSTTNQLDEHESFIEKTS